MPSDKNTRAMYRHLERLPDTSAIPESLLRQREEEIARRTKSTDWRITERQVLTAARLMTRTDCAAWAPQESFPVSVDWYSLAREVTEWEFKQKQFSIADLKRLVAKHACDHTPRTPAEMLTIRERGRERAAETEAALAIMAARGLPPAPAAEDGA